MSSTAALPTAFDNMRWQSWIALAALWFAAVHFMPLLDPDEARYAEIPREMAASGDWLTPRLNGLKYFEKPPLQYWGTAALYEAFGVNDWTARAWSLLLSFLCLPLTFAWVKRFYGMKAALASLAVLASGPLFVLVGHLNLLDGAFTFLLSATVFAFATAQMQVERSRAERSWMGVAWAAAAFAVLSKGIVVPVLAGLALIAYCLIERDWRVWRRLHLLPGASLLLLIGGPWFIAVSRANPEFPRFFFLHEHLERFLTTVHKHGEPWWYFVPVLVLTLLPWLSHSIPALRAAWQERYPNAAFRPRRFLLVYAAVVLIFFSLSQSKLPPYILPMLPPLAAILGAHLAERDHTLRRPAWIAAGTVLFVAMGLVIYVLHRYDAAPSRLLYWVLAAAAVIIGSALGVRRWSTLSRNTLIFTAASLVAWQCLMAAYSVPPMTRSTSGVMDAVKPWVSGRSELFSVGQYRPSASYYLGRSLTLVDYQGEMEFGMQQEPGYNAATRDQFMQRWRASENAVAFFDPEIWGNLSGEGLPGRVLASDRYSIVVSRR